MSDLINSRYYNILAPVLVVLAVVLLSVLVYSPDVLGIRLSDTTPEYGSKMFDKNEITSINIEISEDVLSEILENPLEEQYYPCNITINGETFTSVGIRTKGMTSLTSVASSDSDRYSFKIKADEYVEGQTFFGLSKFVINNVYQDNTYMKEYLAYDMMDFMGVPTPYYAFAEITVNDEPWGLYLAVETLEEDFAERSFGNNYGEMYKPETMDNFGGGPGGNNGNFPGMPGNMPDMSGMPGNMPDMSGMPGNMPDMSGMPGNMPDMSGVPGNMPDMSGMPGNMPDMSGMPENMPDMSGMPENMPDMSGMPGSFSRGNRSGERNAFAGPGGSSGGGADLVYIDDDISSYNRIFDNTVFRKTNDADKKRVIEALKYLNDPESCDDLGEYVNIDETLRYFAVNTFVVNLDSYVSGLKHNYYLYEEDGQLSILPWDLNLAFGGFQSGSASSAVNFPIDEPVSSGVSLSERPMIGTLLANETYKARYHEIMQELIDGYFESGRCSETITRVDALINESVRNDPTAFCTFDEYQKGVSALRLYCELRTESVAGQLNGTVPSTYDDQEAFPERLISASGLSLSDMGTQGGGPAGNGNTDRFRMNGFSGDGSSENDISGNKSAGNDVSGRGSSSDEDSLSGNSPDPENERTAPERLPEKDELSAGKADIPIQENPSGKHFREKSFKKRQ